MKFPCTLKNALLIIRDRFGLSFASKGLGYLAALLLLLSLLARYKLSCYQTTLLLTISALADITLLKTTCHFLLLLVGFDTLTYRKELQLIPYTCGSSMAAREGTNKLIAQVSPGGNGIFWQVHQPRPHIGLESQREVVGKHLLISSSSSLNNNGVDAQELCRVHPPIVLLGYFWLERANDGQCSCGSSRVKEGTQPRKVGTRQHRAHARRR